MNRWAKILAISIVVTIVTFLWISYSVGYVCSGDSCVHTVQSTFHIHTTILLFIITFLIVYIVETIDKWKKSSKTDDTMSLGSEEKNIIRWG